jgi:iron complex transport system substrate-binding protein
MVTDLLKSLFPLLMMRLNLLKSLMLLAGVAMLAADADARTVTDGIGRQIFVPDNPLRVVALAPSITEIMFALGQEKRLAGISRFSDFPPEAMHLPRVGSYIQPDIERIISLNPDLCIAVKDGNPRAVADQLAFLHIPVYAVDPRDLEAVMTMVLQIGNLLNAEHRARSIVKEMASRIERVRQQVVKTAYRPKVFFQIGIAPIVSVGKGTFIDELIRIAGGINVCESDAAYPRLSREQVIARAPDVLVVTTMHRGISRDQILAEWAPWTQIPAVQHGRIAIVDSDIFDRPTPRLVDALEQLVQIFHPELLQDSP